MYAYFTTGKEPYTIYYKRSFCGCANCVRFKPMECENVEETGAMDRDSNVVPVAVFSWEYRTGTLKKANNQIRNGPKKGRKPQEFQNEWNIEVYTEREKSRAFRNPMQTRESESDSDSSASRFNDSTDEDSTGKPIGKRGRRKKRKN